MITSSGDDGVMVDDDDKLLFCDTTVMSGWLIWINKFHISNFSLYINWMDGQVAKFPIGKVKDRLRSWNMVFLYGYLDPLYFFRLSAKKTISWRLCIQFALHSVEFIITYYFEPLNQSTMYSSSHHRCARHSDMEHLDGFPFSYIDGYVTCYPLISLWPIIITPES